MKKRHDNIEAEVAKTLNLLDEMKPLEVSHFFRVRLMQQIEQSPAQGLARFNTGWGSGRLDVRLALMALLIIVNLASALIAVTRDNTQVKSGISEVMDSQSYDYTRSSYAYYDQTGTFPSDSEANGSQNP
ncbi:MAG: hypothetical protein HGA62_09125 [Chlorobiaceae bacterium]|nr:hypothetical protein [Chlorobiaceae bacterium]NTV60159.1 hypothetical protein [Chlorobiaceae bacterium]